jgi:hypothetical protein
MKELIKRNLIGKKILIFFVLTGIIYGIMLGITGPKVMSMAGGMRILDLMPTGYDAVYVNTLFDALGAEGRSTYLFNQLPLDLIFPLLSGISFCLIMAWFLSKYGKLETNWFYLCYLPVFAGLSDYLENFGIIAMISSYPHISVGLIKTTSLFTLLKSSITTLYFIILIIMLILYGKNIFPQKKKSIR